MAKTKMSKTKAELLHEISNLLSSSQNFFEFFKKQNVLLIASLLDLKDDNLIEKCNFLKVILLEIINDIEFIKEYNKPLDLVNPLEMFNKHDVILDCIDQFEKAYSNKKKASIIEFKRGKE